MTSQFHFKNFEADETIKSFASLAMNRILDFAPSDATGVALLEKKDEGYHCSFEIYSRQGPFIANVIRPTALEAISTAERRLKKQVERWHVRRDAKYPFPVQTFFSNGVLT